MNGEVRDLVEKADTPVLAGYQIYHNYLRPHEASKGKTPAEKCGIVIEGGNKWKTVVEKSTRIRDKRINTNKPNIDI